MRKWLPGAIAITVLLSLLLSGTVVIVNADSTEVTGIVPLTVFNITATDITSSGVTLTWDTNGDSTSQVLYGTVAGSYTSQTAVSDTSPNVSHHSVILSGLNAGTSYHCQVQSTMNSGAISAVSDDYSFTTLSPGIGGGGGGGGGSGGNIIVSTNGPIPTGKLTLPATSPTPSPIETSTSVPQTSLPVIEPTPAATAGSSPVATSKPTTTPALTLVPSSISEKPPELPISVTLIILIGVFILAALITVIFTANRRR